MNIILLGAPGAGKGTIAKKLTDTYGMEAISTGDIFRAAIKNESELGKRVKVIVEGGDLVPDELTVALVKERLSGNNFPNGFILDGFPRTVAQAEALYNWSESPKIEAVINFDIESEELIKRLSGRWICRSCGATYHESFMPSKEAGKCDKCGGELYQRADDMRESVEKRLKVYEAQTFPLIDFYKNKGLLRQLKAQGKPEDVFKEIQSLLSL